MTDLAHCHQSRDIRLVQEKMNTVELPHQTGSSTCCKKSLDRPDLMDITESREILINKYFQ